VLTKDALFASTPYPTVVTIIVSSLSQPYGCNLFVAKSFARSPK
jgi:hypothetical protein